LISVSLIPLIFIQHALNLVEQLNHDTAKEDGTFGLRIAGSKG
jgi:hypothetical protein